MANDLNKVTALRSKENADIIARMRSGKSLTRVDAQATWYPPRPKIKKDLREIARVYKKD